jgi:hypothetical protein
MNDGLIEAVKPKWLGENTAPAGLSCTDITAPSESPAHVGRSEGTLFLQGIAHDPGSGQTQRAQKKRKRRTTVLSIRIPSGQGESIGLAIGGNESRWGAALDFKRVVLS